MSYILDALKKAAEQRGEGAPGYRRVVSAPAAPVDNRRTWTRIGLIALCAVAAGAVAFAAVRRTPVATVVVVAPQPSVVAPQPGVVAPQPAVVAPQRTVVAPQPAVVAPQRTVVAPQPAVVAPQRTVVAPQPAVVGRPPAEASRAPAPVSAPPRVVAPVVSAPREQAPTPRMAPAPSPVVPVTPRRDSPVPAVTPPSAPAPMAGGDAKLKLEVLVYSDVASERMVFINGRKYLQGDTVAEHARVEEIQPDGVVLSEQGRRFTLRH